MPTIEIPAVAVELKGQPVALIVSGPERVEINDFRGMSMSRRDAEGRLVLEVSGSPYQGRSNEGAVRKVLGQALTGVAAFRALEPPTEHEDARGIDGHAVFADRKVAIQIVVVPPDSLFRREIAAGIATRTLSNEEAAEWIQQSIEHKLTIAPADRGSMILALDARYAGLLTDDVVLECLRRNHPPAASHGFAAIWLVGPVVARCVKLA